MKEAWELIPGFLLIFIIIGLLTYRLTTRTDIKKTGLTGSQAGFFALIS